MLENKGAQLIMTGNINYDAFQLFSTLSSFLFQNQLNASATPLNHKQYMERTSPDQFSKEIIDTFPNTRIIGVIGDCVIVGVDIEGWFDSNNSHARHASIMTMVKGGGAFGEIGNSPVIWIDEEIVRNKPIFNAVLQHELNHYLYDHKKTYLGKKTRDVINRIPIVKYLRENYVEKRADRGVSHVYEEEQFMAELHRKYEERLRRLGIDYISWRK